MLLATARMITRGLAVRKCFFQFKLYGFLSITFLGYDSYGSDGAEGSDSKEVKETTEKEETTEKQEDTTEKQGTTEGTGLNNRLNVGGRSLLQSTFLFLCNLIKKNPPVTSSEGSESTTTEPEETTASPTSVGPDSSEEPQGLTDGSGSESSETKASIVMALVMPSSSVYTN